MLIQAVYNRFHPAPVPSPAPSMSMVAAAVGQPVHYWDAKGHDATITVTGIYENSRMKDNQGRAVGTATKPWVCATYTIRNNTDSSDAPGFRMQFPSKIGTTQTAVETCDGVTVREQSAPGPGQTLTFAMASSEELREHITSVEATTPSASTPDVATWTIGAPSATNADQAARATAHPTSAPPTYPMGSTQNLSLGANGSVAITPSLLTDANCSDDYQLVKVTIRNTSTDVSSLPVLWITGHTRYGDSVSDGGVCSDNTGLDRIGSPDLAPGQTITGLVVLERSDAKDDPFRTLTFEGSGDLDGPSVTFGF